MGRTQTHPRMSELAKNDIGLAQRISLLALRVSEHLFVIESDPGCQVNLVAYPDYQGELSRIGSLLENRMRETYDPACSAFVGRQDKDELEAFMGQLKLPPG